MAIRAHEYDKVIAKFGFESKETHHKLVWLTYKGKKVVRTRRSHVKGRDLPAEHAIYKQLHLSRKQFRNAVACTLGLDDYIKILKGRGVI